MVNLDATLIVAAIGGATVGASLTLQILSWKAKRRANELRTANKAMRTYYTLLEDIVDDPALPDEAAEFLSIFAEILPKKRECHDFASGLLNYTGNGSKEAGSKIFQLMENLGKTRPDLREKFHKAVFNGLIAVFHRWPGNSWKFSQMMQSFGSDPKKEYQLVYKLARAQNDPKHRSHAMA